MAISSPGTGLAITLGKANVKADTRRVRLSFMVLVEVMICLSSGETE
jgi:hypothetical protein